MSKVLNGEVDSEEFAVECAVTGLRWAEFLRKVGNGMPLLANSLL